MMRLLLTICLCAALCGCVTVHSRFTEESVDAAGNPIVTKDRGTAIAASGSKLEPSTHSMAYKAGGADGWDLTVGQTSEGGNVESPAATLDSLRLLLNLLGPTPVPLS